MMLQTLVRSSILFLALLMVPLGFSQTSHRSGSGPYYEGGYHTTSHGWPLLRWIWF
jgi:hypothetical protein